MGCSLTMHLLALPTQHLATTSSCYAKVTCEAKAYALLNNLPSPLDYAVASYVLQYTQKPSGPVTCLSMTFKSDDSRCAHFTKQVITKYQTQSSAKKRLTSVSSKNVLNLYGRLISPTALGRSLITQLNVEFTLLALQAS